MERENEVMALMQMAALVTP